MARILAVLALASATAQAQAPVVGDINFYGLRKITSERILGVLKLASGDRLPGSKGGMEETIAEIPGVVLSRVEAVCCEGARVSLFIGIEERGAVHAVFRSSPAGMAVLPQSIMDSYDAYLTAAQRAAVRGEGGLPVPDAQFAKYAAEHLTLLDDVLHNASGAEHRSVAAALMGYAPEVQPVVDGLQYALQDPDETVRANAARALGAIAAKPDSKVKIAPTWLVELLNSIMLSDRVEALKVLLTLTEHGNAGALDLVRERALPSLAEMGRWSSPRYALPAFLLLGRVAGMAEADVQEYWKKGDRDPVVQKALGGAGRKPPV